MPHRTATRLAILFSAAALSACTTSRPPDTPFKGPPYNRMLLQEYEQLAGLPSPELFGRSTHGAFGEKAGQVRKGRCVEPETIAAWRNAERIVVQRPAPRGQVAAVPISEIRRDLIALLTGQPKDSSPLPADLPAAQGHALGRFDCIVAFGRSDHPESTLALCTAEFLRAADYVSRVMTPAAPHRGDGTLCGAPPAQPQGN